jgi:peptide/nickel transport system ATP-binding protein
MNQINYSVTIRAGARELVSVDAFPVAQNQITFLFGESGIGKSIISKAVYGLLDPGDLEGEIDGRSYAAYQESAAAKELRQNSFFVFQEPSSHLNNLLKISEQLAEGSLGRATTEKEILHHLWQTTDDQMLRKIIGIYPKPYRPSGGEKQRILLTMAFKKIEVWQNSAPEGSPSFFVFDEPTGSLDNHYRNLFLGLLLDKYRRRPFTAVLITHDYSIISEIYQQHKDLLPRVHFQELSRQTGSRVVVNNFMADEYLSWLKDTRGRRIEAGTGEPVLSVKSAFRIFNRQCGIYRDQAHIVLRDLVIRPGEMAYLKAPSGMGKTTLAKIVMGLYPPEQASFTLAGTEFTERTSLAVWQKKIWGKKATMVFQHADEALDLQATVAEIFAGLPLQPILAGDRLKARLQELFEGEITPAFMNKKAGLLSGGQKQRLNLLRALALGTDLLILDEPLNALDFGSIKKVLALLDEKCRQGTAILMISHNEEIMESLVGPEQVFYLGIKTNINAF